jgi:hypothetical protein
MNEFKVYPISKLPFYLIEFDDAFQASILDVIEDILGSNVDNITVEVAPNWIPNWVKNNIILGNLGEEMALAYLKKQFSRIERISISSSSDGYDIKADEQCFEIKTSISKDYTFEISVNQLKKANIEKIHYNIFYIFIDKDKKNAMGYIIKNPIQKFEVKLDQLLTSINPFEPTGFKVKMADYLHLTEKIDLTDIFQSIFTSKTEYINLFNR